MLTPCRPSWITRMGSRNFPAPSAERPEPVRSPWMAPRDTWIVQPGEAGTRLDRFLADATRLQSRGRAVDALECGKVFVNGEEAAQSEASRRLAAGDAVRVWMDRPGSSRKRSLRP